jgi:hypothetical protein
VLRFAAAAAALAVMKWGSQELYASRDEIDRWAATVKIEAPDVGDGHDIRSPMR